MNAKILKILAAVSLVALGIGGLLTLHAQQEIVFGQADLQPRLDQLLNKELPIKGPASDIVTSLQARAAHVSVADGRVDVNFVLQGKLVFGQGFSLAASMRGAPRYADGAFYFEPEEVRLVKFVLGAEGALNGVLGRLAGAGAADALQQKTRGLEAAAQQLAQNAMKAELAKRPIYRLKDDAKGEILRESLDSLAVEADKVVLRVTLWRVTFLAALGAATVLAGLVALVFALRATAQ